MDSLRATLEEIRSKLVAARDEWPNKSSREMIELAIEDVDSILPDPDGPKPTKDVDEPVVVACPECGVNDVEIVEEGAYACLACGHEWGEEEEQG